MKFNETKLEGVCLINITKKEDERGFFARVFDKDEFLKAGIDCTFIQQSISFNKKKGTLRGMHYQENPYGEDKLVRVTHGSAYYVVLDLRRDSATFKEHIGITLSQDNYSLLFVPKGMALGFITLVDNSEIFYQMSQIYVSEAVRGIRWNDLAFNIKWPFKPTVISEEDVSYNDYENK